MCAFVLNPYVGNSQRDEKELPTKSYDLQRAIGEGYHCNDLYITYVHVCVIYLIKIVSQLKMKKEISLIIFSGYSLHFRR